MKSKTKLTFFRKILPSPFALAIILTAVTIFLALVFAPSSNNIPVRFLDILGYWQKGFWELLAFGMQMMLMLVLGNVLALTPIFDKIISRLLKFANSNTSAVVLVAVVSIVLAYLNWGLSLILSALLAARLGEKAKERNLKINYPLLGAAAYSGLMVWHGGFSGSAPLKVAENGHFLFDKIGKIGISQTILSPMNLTVMLATVLIIPALFYILAKRNTRPYDFTTINFSKRESENAKPAEAGAAQLNYARWFSLSFGLLMIFAAIVNYTGEGGGLNINGINFILFGLSLILYPNLQAFSQAVSGSISNATGIMLQFPLYAGIMGIMKYSGLTLVFTDFFVRISTPESFPLLSMISAGIVNFFVPSGGGQWAVQGPILTEAAQHLGVSIPKTIMALAYGDELTNMLQPFWALPLLGITKLKAREILPYSAIIMLAGFIIYALALLYF